MVQYLEVAMFRSNRILLAGAVVATPFFVLLWALQAVTRDGFRPAFHPMSLLSLGDGGWVQILNFVVTGLLIAGGGIGLRRLGRWVSRCVVLMGVGLVLAGVFVTDAGAGFPAGAPAGAPEMSWHGALHQVGFLLTQLAFVAGSVILAVRFRRDGRPGWAIACVAALVAAVLAPLLGGPETLALRLVVSAAIELGLISVIAREALSRRAERISA